MRNDDSTYVEIYTICLIDWRDLINLVLSKGLDKEYYDFHYNK